MNDELPNYQCALCGQPTPMDGTRRCDACWELERRIQADPERARKILASLSACTTESRGENDVEGRASLAPEAHAASATHREQDGAATVVTAGRDRQSISEAAEAFLRFYPWWEASRPELARDAFSAGANFAATPPHRAVPSTSTNDERKDA